MSGVIRETAIFSHRYGDLPERRHRKDLEAFSYIHEGLKKKRLYCPRLFQAREQLCDLEDVFDTSQLIDMEGILKYCVKRDDFPAVLHDDVATC